MIGNVSDLSSNRAIVLTEVLGFEITSEHITLQSEDRVTHVSQSQNSDRTNAANLLSMNFLFIDCLTLLCLAHKRLLSAEPQYIWVWFGFRELFALIISLLVRLNSCFVESMFTRLMTSYTSAKKSVPNMLSLHSQLLAFESSLKSYLIYWQF